MFLKKKNTIFLILLMIFSKICFSNEMMFENFDDTSKKKWKFISDEVMGGISFGNFKILSEKNISFLRLSGYVSLENNGGFIQVRRQITREDISKLTGFKLRIRGNDSHYYIHLRTKFTMLPWQYYQAKINASQEWSEVVVDLKEFYRSGVFLPKTIKPSTIKSFAIVAFGREHNVRLDIDKVIFY